MQRKHEKASEIRIKVSYITNNEEKTGIARLEIENPEDPTNPTWEITPDDPGELGPRFRFKNQCEIIDQAILSMDLMAGCNAMAAQIEIINNQTHTEMSDTNQTLGQRRVKAEFNPAKNAVVDQIKNKSAELIDLVETLKNFEGRSERNRQISMAQSAFEVGCMHGVKACFTED